MEEEEVETLSVAELRHELGELNLSKDGKKAVLVNRLKKAIRSENKHNKSKKDVQDNSDEEDQFEDASTSMNKEQRSVFTFRDVEEAMVKFSGDNKQCIKKWFNEFEDTCRMLNWNDLHRLIYCKRLLCGSAKLFVNYELNATDYNELKEGLIAEFEVNINSAVVHQQLMRRKKLANESYREYVYCMLDIANQSKIEVGAVIQYIIDGISDYEQNKSVLYGAKSIKELKDKLKIYELIKERSNQNKKVTYQHSAKSNNYSNYNAPTNSKGDNNNTDFKNNNNNNNASSSENSRYNNHNQNQRAIRCYGCGEIGHTARECKNKSVKCFKCNEFGHIAPNCTNKSSSKNKGESVTLIKDASMYKDILLNDVSVSALVDTGSEINIITVSVYKNIGAPTKNQEIRRLNGLSQTEVKTLGKTQVSVEVDDCIFDKVEFHIIRDEDIAMKVILGVELLKNAEIKINSNGVQFVNESSNKENNIMNVNIFSDGKKSQSEDIELFHLDTNIKNEVVEIIDSYIPTNNKKDTNVQMKILLSDEAPIYQCARRLPQQEKRIVEKQVENWLSEGICQQSYSEFGSAVVIVKKKDGSNRVCVDYRRINKKIIKDRFPFPIIDDVLDRLEGARFFTTIDLKNGFFHVDVEESSRKYTAFVTHNGQYEFLKVPFGLCNSPAVFQRFINHIFRDLISNGVVLTYVDDIIIPSKSVEEGLSKFKVVLQRAKEFGLNIQWKKCQILKSTVDFLGYIIEDGQIKPSNEKTKAVQCFPEPKTIKQVQSFLGLSGYFRKFIMNYSVIAKPLSDLTRGEQVFVFDEIQKSAFLQLKDILSSKPVLQIYSPDLETELHTDASKYGFGSILMQRGNDLKLHPVCYMSKKTTSAEEKYNSYELEVLAVINSLKKFRVYLLGRKFKIVTDCSAFQKTMEKKELVTRVARWALILEEFDYSIEHRAGSAMRHVDSLSRNPMVMIVNDGIIERVKNAQNKDKELMDIKSAIDEPKNKDYCIKNDVLYKYKDGVELLVVPKRMQTEVIRRVHENGHFNHTKVKDVVKMQYYMSNLSEKCEEVVKNCVKCILIERKRGKKEGFLNPIPKGDRPLETFHIDHLGQMTATSKNYKYVFVVIDAFTKFVWIYPTKTTNTKEALDKLEIQKVVFGNPKRIISDRGSAFTSNDFENYCIDEDIEHVLITTGVPRANGQVERINEIIIPVLAKLAIDEPDKWYKYVGKVQQAINSTTNRSIGRSPFELLIGSKMRRPEDVRLFEVLEEEHMKLFDEERDEMRQHALQKISKLQEENKKNYNRKCKEANKYKEGDLVAIKRTQYGAGLKIRAKYLGPYEIVKVKRNNRYDVQKCGNQEGPSKTSTSADHMKPWVFGEDESESD